MADAFRIYQIDDKNIGIVVNDDIFFPEVIRTLTLNSCDFIISIGTHKIDQSLITVQKCHSLLNGISIITLTDDGVVVTEYKGQYALINRDNCVKVNIETEHNDYYLSCVREDIYNNVFMEKKN
jgi:predicted amidohydrolase